MGKEYDLLVCGITGFTGKLAAEFLFTASLLNPATGRPITWAACARSEERARDALTSARANAVELAGAGATVPSAESVPIEVVDLTLPEGEGEAAAFERLKNVV